MKTGTCLTWEDAVALHAAWPRHVQSRGSQACIRSGHCLMAAHSKARPTQQGMAACCPFCLILQTQVRNSTVVFLNRFKHLKTLRRRDEEMLPMHYRGSCSLEKLLAHSGLERRTRVCFRSHTTSPVCASDLTPHNPSTASEGQLESYCQKTCASRRATCFTRGMQGSSWWQTAGVGVTAGGLFAVSQMFVYRILILQVFISCMNGELIFSFRLIRHLCCSSQPERA